MIMSKVLSKAQVQTKTSTSKAVASSTPKPSSRNGLVATTLLTTVKYTIDADVIKCPQCLELFKSPRLLQCGHSLCLECLDSLILYTESTKAKDTFPCPVCQKTAQPRDTNVSRHKWASQFPVNAALIRLLRNATVKNPNDNGAHKAFCQTCLLNNKTRNTACYCNTCLEHLCDICFKYHEKQDETKCHDVTVYFQKDDVAEKNDPRVRNDWQKRTGSKTFDDKNAGLASNENGRRTRNEPIPRDGKLAPIGNVVVAQTVTTADSMGHKLVTKLGSFSGMSSSDSSTSDFRSVAFLTNNKIVLGDLANKKLKVFDVFHKTRVELITEMVLRADPIQMCRVDDNTVAVVTDRSGNHHIRLFTIRDKIMHFVHRTIEGIPLGVGCLNNTVVCSFLGDVSLYKYKLTRAQQLKLGPIKKDRTGNDLFHHPGALCSGYWRGIPVLYIADETDFGVTVCAIDARGDKKMSVFFEIPVPKAAKSPKRPANTASKTKRARSVRSGLNAPRPRNTTSQATSPKQTAGKSQSQTKERVVEEGVSGRHTFQRVDDMGRTIVQRKTGREIERTPTLATLRTELSIDLNKLTGGQVDPDEDMGAIVTTTSKKPLRTDSKAVERAARRPVGKVVPQQTTTHTARPRSDKTTSSETAMSTFNPNSTITSESTIGTIAFAPPKLVYRADSIEVDNSGNIYVCMSSLNKIHQMSADGQLKRDLLTEKDGIVAPKVISFSPKNDFFIVTSLKNNKVLLYRPKRL